MNEKPNAAPEWKLVPVEPTQDMLYAMAEHDGHKRGDREHPSLTRWEDYWSAAIAAAPNLPDSETRESVEAIMVLADQLRSAAFNYGYEDAHPSNATTRQDKAAKKVDERRTAIRAAVERVFADLARYKRNDELQMQRAIKAEQEAAELRALWFADADPRETKHAKEYAASASAAIEGKP